MTVLGILAILGPTLHAEEALKYPFSIPDRPVFSKQAFDLEVQMAQRDTQIVDTASKNCPKVTSLYNKIFEKMVDANHLREFVDENRPGIKLSIGCYNVLPRGTGNGPDTGAFSFINLPASILAYSSSEDEIAATIGHEMGHILLGHEEANILLSPASQFMLPEDGVQAKATDLLVHHAELDADRLGLILMLNAGYNPQAAISSLWRGIQFYSDNFLVAHSPIVIWSTGSDMVHPNLGTRARAIEQTLKDLNYHEKVASKVSPEFYAAQDEVTRLKSEIKNH